MAMETSSPLATESFSYSWLSNTEPSLEVKPKRVLTEAHESFNFDPPVSQSSYALLHADELFSDGLIRPTSAGPPDLIKTTTPATAAAVGSSSFPSRHVIPALQGHYDSLNSKWRVSIKKILLKCSGYLRRSMKRSSRVDDTDRREREVNNKSWSNSPQASPKGSPGDCSDIDNSIYEAILHCKTSINREMITN